VNEIFQRLAKQLLEKNRNLSSEEALTWVEVLWEDVQTTNAKAGHPYVSPEVTENMIVKWINYYGPMFHEVLHEHPKFQQLVKEHKFNAKQ